MNCRNAWLWLCWVIFGVTSLSCGCSRTGLPTVEFCDDEEATRPCANQCGNDGAQVCRHGYWQRCVVPPQSLPCSNACGEGVAQCVDNVIGECVVPKVPVEACETSCGAGQKVCRDGVWGSCEYTGEPRSCATECGEGTQACVNGKWATCLVPRQEVFCETACGSGKRACENGRWSACDAPQPLPPKLHASIRDFDPKTHPDFERPDLPMGDVNDRGAVLPELGSDGLPVYASTRATETITSPASFNQWFRDVEGINVPFDEYLQLRASPSEPGMFVYEDDTFFPIDGRGLGNYVAESGRTYSHNYHFTLMVQTEFYYVGGETFSFSGDDDMWVFINRKLAIDLGGIHEIQTASVDLDERASVLGITPGNYYDLRFFFAERRTIGSNFMIRTSIADVGSCP